MYKEKFKLGSQVDQPQLFPEVVILISRELHKNT
jgi:hypothetical protein